VVSLLLATSYSKSKKKLLDTQNKNKKEEGGTGDIKGVVYNSKLPLLITLSILHVLISFQKDKGIPGNPPNQNEIEELI